MQNETQPLRVLIVEDDATDFFIICEYIKGIKNRSFIVEQCSRYSDALELIIKKLYDIYFIDYRLGAKTGLDLLRAAIELHCEEPLILLTGKGNALIDQEAMEMGAADYLIKSEINSEHLERSMRYALSRTSVLKALRSSEKKYRTIFEHSQEAIFIAGPGLTFKDLNQAACKLFECERPHLLPLSLFDFIQDESIKEKINNRLLLAEEVYDLEIEITIENEESKNCILSIAQELNTTGETIFHGIIHDITNLKKAEKATLQAQKLASIWRLARTLAHEVRNPLSTIQMSIEQLQDLETNEEKEFYLDIIRRNSQRINNLITELLESSHPGDIQVEMIDLQEIVKDTIQLARDRINLKGIQLTVELPNNPCKVNAHAEKLKIALLNILVNAIEAVESNQGSIHIKIINDGKTCRITLTDNGCGIPPENLSSLFEPYFTSKKNGMGLGLATTLTIIKAHLGEIEVTSEVNKGTNFIVTLPLLDNSTVYHSVKKLTYE